MAGDGMRTWMFSKRRRFMKSNATIVLLAKYSLMSILIALAPQKLSAQNNSWVQTNGPYGAGVNSILIDSTDSLLAGTD